MGKNKHNNNGFTLTEMLVVIAIIGILSAILVPSLLYYLRSARLDTANANAKYIYNAVNDYSQKCINFGVRLPEGTYPDSGWITIEARDTAAKVPEDAIDSVSAAVAQQGIEDAVNFASANDEYDTVYQVQINQYGGVAAVIWAKTEGDIYVGGFPNPAEKNNWTLSQAAKSS